MIKKLFCFLILLPLTVLAQKNVTVSFNDLKGNLLKSPCSLFFISDKGDTIYPHKINSSAFTLISKPTSDWVIWVIYKTHSYVADIDTGFYRLGFNIDTTSPYQTLIAFHYDSTKNVQTPIFGFMQWFSWSSILTINFPSNKCNCVTADEDSIDDIPVAALNIDGGRGSAYVIDGVPIIDTILQLEVVTGGIPASYDIETNSNNYYPNPFVGKKITQIEPGK